MKNQLSEFLKKGRTIYILFLSATFIVCLFSPVAYAEESASFFSEEEQEYYNQISALDSEAADIWEQRLKEYEADTIDDNALERVVFVGDSLTFNMDYSRVSCREDQVLFNRGIGGEKIRGLTARLDRIASLDPKKIFVMIGINNNYMSIFAEDGFVDQYIELFNALDQKMPYAEKYIVSILPINESLLMDISNEKIQYINSILEALSFEYHFQYIDLFSDFDTAGDGLPIEYTPDGLHLNEDGKRIYYQLIESYICAETDSAEE